MKTKQQLIAELSCIQRHLTLIVGEIISHHRDLIDNDCDNMIVGSLQSSRGNAGYVRQCIIEMSLK